MIKKLLLLITLFALLAALSGCDTAVQGAVQGTACLALERLDDPIDKLAEAVGNASTADLKDLKAKLDGPVQSVQSANQALNAPGITQWLLGYNFLSETIDELPADEALSPESKEKVDSAIGDLRSKLNEVFDSLECETA
jgi:hypothetical protein